MPSPNPGQIRFIGNATVHVQWGGLNLLTDPNFIHAHERVSIAPGITAERLRDPAAQLSDLPPLDAIVLSHFHGDHFDQVAERELPRDIPILTPPSAVPELDRRGFTAARGLDPWQSETIGTGDHTVTVTAVPGRHGPPVVDLVLPDVMGSIWDLDAPTGSIRLYVSGDTLVFDDLHEIPRRYPGIAIGLFHLGGTTVAGLMVTMDGEQGIEAVQIIGPQRAIPIHFDDYDLFASPLTDFLDQADAAGWRDRVTVLERGASLPLAIEPATADVD